MDGELTPVISVTLPFNWDNEVLSLLNISVNLFVLHGRVNPPSTLPVKSWKQTLDWWILWLVEHHFARQMSQFVNLLYCTTGVNRASLSIYLLHSLVCFAKFIYWPPSGSFRLGSPSPGRVGIPSLNLGLETKTPGTFLVVITQLLRSKCD